MTASTTDLALRALVWRLVGGVTTSLVGLATVAAAQDGAPPARPAPDVEASVGASADSRTDARAEVADDVRAPAQGAERAAALDLFAIEPFDAVAWERRLSQPDLARREQAYERLLARLPSSPAARAWVEARATSAADDVAWTCRLMLRDHALAQSLERPLRRGNDDRVILGRATGDGVLERTVDVVRLDAAAGAALRREALRIHVTSESGADASGTRALWIVGGDGPAVFEFAPAVPWARPSELVFERATVQTDGATDATRSWRVLEGLPLDQAHVAVLDLGDAPRALTATGANPGLELLRRRAAEEPVSLARLGVFVDPDERGVVVLDVEPGSLAHLMGVVRGDRIAAIDAERVARPEDITALLAAARERGSIELRWQRASDGRIVERRYVVPGAARGRAAPAVGAAAEPVREAPEAEPVPPAADAPTPP
jgi:hypothetical protein